MKAAVAKGSILVLIGWLALLPASSASPRLASSSYPSARGVRLPVYLPGESKAVATIHIGRVTQASKRVGMLRLGLVPVAAAQDVRLIFHQPNKAAAALASASATLQRLGIRESIELQNLRLQCVGKVDEFLEAGAVTMASESCWRLSGGVRARVGGRLVRASSARLHFSEAAGVALQWEARGRTNAISISFPSPSNNQPQGEP